MGEDVSQATKLLLEADQVYYTLIEHGKKGKQIYCNILYNAWPDNVFFLQRRANLTAQPRNQWNLHKTKYLPPFLYQLHQP